MGTINATINYKGKSGKNYQFSLYTINSEFTENSGGVYIITKRTENPDGNGTHKLLYIGKANKFQSRFSNHEKWDAFMKNDANCVGIYKTSSETESLDIEEDLIKEQSPLLNSQHN